MLKIIKGSEPLSVERLVICLYGAPGLGKTTAAFTAESPILFDCDKGAYRAKNRKDVVAVDRWADIAEMTADDLAPYKTVVLDTAGRALDFLSADIIAKNPKMGYGGALSLQGFGQLKSRFSAWLKQLRTFGKDVILVAHMDEQRNGDDVIERLDVQGGSKGEIYKSADAMGRIIMRQGERYLDFNPRENSFGKNPCELPVMPLPAAATETMADVIATIKDRLNASAEIAKEADRELTDWTIKLNDVDSADGLNGMLPAIKKANPAVQFYAAKRAKDLGLTFNKVKRLYEALDVAAAR